MNFNPLCKGADIRCARVSAVGLSNLVDQVEAWASTNQGVYVVGFELVPVNPPPAPLAADCNASSASDAVAGDALTAALALVPPTDQILTFSTVWDGALFQSTVLSYDPTNSGYTGTYVLLIFYSI